MCRQRRSEDCVPCLYLKFFVFGLLFDELCAQLLLAFNGIADDGLEFFKLLQLHVHLLFEMAVSAQSKHQRHVSTE